MGTTTAAETVTIAHSSMDKTRTPALDRAESFYALLYQEPQDVLQVGMDVQGRRRLERRWSFERGRTSTCRLLPPLLPFKSIVANGPQYTEEEYRNVLSLIAASAMVRAAVACSRSSWLSLCPTSTHVHPTAPGARDQGTRKCAERPASRLPPHGLRAARAVVGRILPVC